MKKKTYKIIICISLVVMLFTSFGNVFGATNPSYSTEKTVDDSGLNAKIQDSLLLDILANMINAVASLAESLIGGVFSTLTGENIFPWADRIIFNAIPFLDINFLNPAPNSLFGAGESETILGRVVKQVYSTIFSLAVLFLGVAVGIMAIRLAISSIAAEKAKYKQALVNWATCLVMLFLMHYILAFVFWINEQLVEVASGILINTIEREDISEVSLKEALDSILSADERVSNFLNASYLPPNSAKSYMKNNADTANKLITNDTYLDTYFSVHMLEDDASGNWWNWAKAWSDRDDRMGKIVVPRIACDAATAKKVAELQENNKALFDEQYRDGIITVNIGITENDFNPPDEQYLYLTPEAFKNHIFKDDNGKDVSYYHKYLAYTFILTSKSIFYKLNNDGDKMECNLIDEYRYYKIKPFLSFTFYRFNCDAQLIRLQTERFDQSLKIHLNNNLDYMMQAWALNWQGNGDSYDDASGKDIEQLLEYIVDSSTVEELEKSLGPKIVNNMVNNRLAIDRAILAAAGVAVDVKSTDNIIANLGEFFKQSAYVYPTESSDDDENNKNNENKDSKKTKVTGWRATKLSVTGALLYAIFIFQSCMYFIMYVKRLFYVMMLSMFGPIVVIYDFFMKSAG